MSLRSRPIAGIAGAYAAALPRFVSKPGSLPRSAAGFFRFLLPEQRLHKDIERLVLYRELVYVIVVGGVVVHRPSRAESIKSPAAHS